MTDLFNNSANDYINPELNCAGNADEFIFEFLPNDQIGIISGSSIIAAMGLSDIQQGVEGWVTQTKILQPGEVTYISGLTKGISNELQYFPFSGDVLDLNATHEYYMTVDISVSYYNNFRYYNRALQAISNPSNEIDIALAFNMLFDTEGIGISAAYDASGLTFTGNTAGYTFDITSVDVSIWDTPGTFFEQGAITEDTDSAIAAFKYPNGAMLGYVLKVIFPTSTQAENDFVMINHVPDFLEYFEPSTGSGYVRYYKAVDVGQSGISCNADTMSAAEYLDYVQTNNKWEKVGQIKIWLSAVDPADSAVENLITGFYVFNPQINTIKIEYMTIL